MERIQYNRIQDILEEKNRGVYWLQSQLEGQTIPCVARWCKNVKQPTIEELFEIAKVLEVDVRDLIVSTNSNPNQDSCDTNIKTSMRQLNISKPIVNKEAKTFDLNSSQKDHKLSFMVFSKDAEFNYYSPIDNSLQWGYKKDESFFKNNEAIFGLSAYLWIIGKQNKEDLCRIFYILNKQGMGIWENLQVDPLVLIREIKKNVPSFKLDSDLYKMKKEIQFAWIDLQSFLMFVKYCTYNMGDLSGRRVQGLPYCSSYEDLATLICSDMHLIRTNGKQEFNDNKEVELPF